jgi:hypothetical protein
MINVKINVAATAFAAKGTTTIEVRTTDTAVKASSVVIDIFETLGVVKVAIKTHVTVHRSRPLCTIGNLPVSTSLASLEWRGENFPLFP